MNIAEPPNIAFFITWIVYFGIRHVFIKRTEGEKKTLSKMDGVERLLLLAMVPGIMVLPLLYLFSSVLSLADYSLPPIVPWIGLSVLFGSLLMFWRSHSDLGQNWSVSIELREGHELVTEGIYGRIRHPMYTSIWLWAIGQGLTLENWLAGWAVVPAFALMYFLRLPREEAMMCEKFGDQYREYMKRTGRLLPKPEKTA
ncbi:MAG: protein-S-isoprenylcysteine methyltransferase [Verrucomicrobiales bacterium]|nr:protein-S-isoprenylcysteine methyltransferase [Verrucomicrobiales bacterium]|tara:strand:+ start:2694 stop:3290 length:597 start_codon:yes stop_codon:yes gene_type:complete